MIAFTQLSINELEMNLKIKTTINVDNIQSLTFNINFLQLFSWL